jgi:Na+/H+ antiporter NhaC
MVVYFIIFAFSILLLVLFLAFYSYPQAKEALEKARDEKEREEIEQSISFIIRGIVFLSIGIIIMIWTLFLMNMQ